MNRIEYFDPAQYLTEPDNLREVVDSHNVAIVDLGKELNPETLYSLAEKLGPVMEEPRLATRKIAYRGSVVRLESVDIPGSTSTGQVECMGMHVDHATSPALEQPSYVLLGSLVPPERNNGGDTAIIPMSSVVENLTAEEIQLLRESRQHFATAYYTSESSANLVSTSRKGEEYISIWDGEPWTLIAPEGTSPQRAEQTVSHLRELIYDKQNVRNVPWEPGRVAVLRNDRMLHGRTAQVEQKRRVMLRAKAY